MSTYIDVVGRYRELKLVDDNICEAEGRFNLAVV